MAARGSRLHAVLAAGGRHATVPTGTHPSALDANQHYRILSSVVAKTNDGTPFWDASITDTLFNWAVANHVGLPVDRLGSHSTHVGDDVFDRLYDDLRVAGVFPLDNAVLADVEWEGGVLAAAGESKAKWLLNLCKRFIAKREYIASLGGMVSFMPIKDWMRDDSGVMLILVKFRRGAAAATIWEASPRLRADREFMLGALKASVDTMAVLMALRPELENDKQFFIEATDIYLTAYNAASQNLRGDREFMLAMIRKDRYAISAASNELLNDPDFMLEAVYAGAPLRYWPEWLKDDKAFAMKRLRRYPDEYYGLTKRLQADQDVKNRWASAYWDRERAKKM